jgi:hypothetical protein
MPANTTKKPFVAAILSFQQTTAHRLPASNLPGLDHLTASAGPTDDVDHLR